MVSSLKNGRTYCRSNWSSRGCSDDRNPIKSTKSSWVNTPSSIPWKREYKSTAFENAGPYLLLRYLLVRYGIGNYPYLFSSSLSNT
jgi:hypothetical protein